MHPGDLDFLLFDGCLLYLDLLLLFKHGLPLLLGGHRSLGGSLCLRVVFLLLGRGAVLRDLFLITIVLVLLFGCRDISLLLRGSPLRLGGGAPLADLVAHGPFECESGDTGRVIRSRRLVNVEVELDGFMIRSLLVHAVPLLGVNILLGIASGRHGLRGLPLGDSLLFRVVLLARSFLAGTRLRGLFEVKLPLIVHLVPQVGREEDKADGDEGCHGSDC